MATSGESPAAVIEEARRFGIDLDLLREALALTPAERLRRGHQLAAHVAAVHERNLSPELRAALERREIEDLRRRHGIPEDAPGA